ncbi:hypothetical protein FQ914_23550 [Escherichia coli]|nr:hypothetical protein FQ914_23550 [Escherichia coli]
MPARSKQSPALQVTFINIRQIVRSHFLIFSPLVTSSGNNLTHSTKRLNRLVVLTTKSTTPHAKTSFC